MNTVSICLFLQGTVLMHASAVGCAREEVVRQVKDKEPSVRDFGAYVPIGHATEKVRNWASKGANVVYLSALTEDKKARGDEIVGVEGLEMDREILDRWGFPQGKILHRHKGESYKDVIEALRPLPDVLIEDNCESIGPSEVTWLTLSPDVQEKIVSIVVPEFGGVDHLPDDPKDLLEGQS